MIFWKFTHEKYAQTVQVTRCGFEWWKQTLQAFNAIQLGEQLVDHSVGHSSAVMASSGKQTQLSK